MGKATGFLEYSRSLPILDDPRDRIEHWEEFHLPQPFEELKRQGARCMNCGTPFCHTGMMDEVVTRGCPLNNLIPEWNDLVYRGRWQEAFLVLSATNNFPEFTGRVCPAPCESSCVLGINADPVMIKEIEVSIIDRAFDEGWVVPRIPKVRSGKRVAIVGSGPAGLACADELNQFGHLATVFERSDRIGGLLMYGIPNMKLDKGRVERRVGLLEDEGIEFRTNITVGRDVTADDLRRDYDALVLCCGVPRPRDLEIKGRGLNGVHFAMDFLTGSTKHLLGDSTGVPIDVDGKNVIVVGGGDTGTDCVATALRQKCKSLWQFEIMPRPGGKEVSHDAWLRSARTFQVDYGQEESAAVFGSDPRKFSFQTKKFVGNSQGDLIGLEAVEIEWKNGNIQEVGGPPIFWKAEAVFLAMGFIGVEKSQLFRDLGVQLTDKNTVAVNDKKQTNVENIFAAGDCERGQSLVVWAIADGRKAASGVDRYLSRIRQS